MSLRKYSALKASNVCFAKRLIKTYVHILTSIAHNCTCFSTSSLVLHILACDLGEEGEGVTTPTCPSWLNEWPAANAVRAFSIKFLHRVGTFVINNLYGLTIFDSRIICRMMCESVLSTNTEIPPVSVALVNQTALRALLCLYFKKTNT